MSVVAVCAMVVAAWCAGRGFRAVRRAEIRRRVRFPDAVAVKRRSGRRGMPRLSRWLAPAGAALAGMALGGPIAAALGAGGVAAGRRVVAGRRTAKVTAARDEQLADAVRAIGSALRAGLSVPQALAYASEEAPAPLSGSLRPLVDDLDLGLPLDAALERWSVAFDTEDGRLLAGVLRLNRRSGGDLPSVLDHVASTLRERRAVAQEVRGLTAQGRLSGAILGLLPIGFFGFLWLTSRKDIEASLQTPAGIGAVAVGLTMEGLAFLWIRRLLEVA